MSSRQLDDHTWSILLNFLKKHPKVYVGFEEDSRRFIEAVLWIHRTGAQWRKLPPEYGKHNSVFCRFNRWSKKGIWQELFDYCLGEPDLEHLLTDMTLVSARACASGAKKGGLNPTTEL